ncbi:MAG: hypothetical protein ACE5PV_02215 [Candidatus Poribacteria bacterium]
MSIKIVDFEWDKHNVEHIQKAHPHLDLEMLEDIVRQAKNYVQLGNNRFGKTVYGARRGRLMVLFNIKAGRIARIFSVRGR